MCHQSVGLLQGAIEAAGISTVCISVRPEVTVNMRVPRAVYVRFPTGNPVGQPNMPNQQRTILRGVLRALQAIQEPGTALEMPYRWKRMPDEDIGAPARSAPTAEPAQVTGPDLYSVAREHVEGIESAYTRLMEQIDGYRAWLEAALAEEQARAETDNAKLQALGPQLRSLDELQRALEGPAHDGLVRVADRAIRIKHWQDGVFI